HDITRPDATPPLPEQHTVVFAYTVHRPLAPRALHSFPTRRSSDLRRMWVASTTLTDTSLAVVDGVAAETNVRLGSAASSAVVVGSEEETSELQIRRELVCGLRLVE